MSETEATEIINENFNFLDKVVLYENQRWVFKRFFNHKINETEFIVRCSLEREGAKGVEFTTPFESPDNFKIL